MFFYCLRASRRVPLACHKTSLVVVFLIIGLMFIPAAPRTFAHLEHLPHYNGMQTGIENHIIQQSLEPEYAAPGEVAEITFSVQDYHGNDIENVETMVEIYESSGKRVYALPWTVRNTGDFVLYYTFPKSGNYQLVLSVANGPVNHNNIDAPRSIISSSSGCNCERVVSNINISTSFGLISNSIMLSALVLASAAAGSVLWANYRRGNLRKKKDYLNLLKYAVMLAAIGGGTLHIVIFATHATLRLEYSIFLIVAGGMQVTYGMLYAFFTLNALTAGTKEWHRKLMSINLFGLAGTAILIGLYAYSLVFPQPLSPTGQPEDLSLEGIIAKSLEVFLIVGILYLIRRERK